MSREFAARHVTGRRVQIIFKDGTRCTGKAMALVNTGKRIAISMYIGFRKYPVRAYLENIEKVLDDASGREIK
jgi:hypothetical protein